MYFFIKIKVLPPQANVTVTDFGYPALALWFYCSQAPLNLMKVIPETRHAH
jgi:hypothetical protein